MTNDGKSETYWKLPPGKNKKDISHYETKSITRGDFKKKCRDEKLKFEDFEEVFSGDKKGTNKLFYYYKIEELI